MKNLKFIVVLLFISGMYLSCSEEPPIGYNPTEPLENEQKPTTLMPLNQENSWTYNEIRITGSGDTLLKGEGNLDIVHSNGKVFNFHNESNIISIDLAKNESEGLYLYDYDFENKKLIREYFFPYPVRIGSDFSYSFNGHEIKVSFNKKSVQAGIFNCFIYTYHFTDDDYAYDEKFYFCPKTGLISYERKDTAKNQAIAQLAFYEVKV